MGNDSKKFDFKSALKITGAYIAFMIGSGFASGQEIMQFYTAFGTRSIIAILLSMVIFAWSGSTFMAVGYDVRNQNEGGEYQRFCGKYLGKFYEILVTVMLFCVTIVMISGSGATLNEYYGLPYYAGTALMAILIYAAYAAGLRKLVDIIGAIGPVIIVFTVGVGLYTLIRNGGSIASADSAMKGINIPKSSSNFFLSAVLYCAYNVFGSVIFFMALGRTCSSHREARRGGIAGGVIFMGTALIMDLAFLANIKQVGTLSIPTLYLANRISPAVGVIFSIVLMLGIFSTAAPMAWSVCDRFVREGTGRSRIFAAVYMVIAFFGGQLPFSKLVGIIYPYTGYLGILLFFCLAAYQIRHKHSKVPAEHSEGVTMSSSDEGMEAANE